MRLDYHMHTLFSDGKGEMAEYAKKAAQNKIDEIGFSDHVHVHKEAWSMSSANLSKYMDSIRRLRKTAQISVKAGLEVDFVPETTRSLMPTINQYDFDYLMGSVHYIGNWLVDSEREIEEWKRRDVDQVYRQYFHLVQDMVEKRLFDIVGHLDLVKKFNFRPKNDLNDLMLQTVQTIRQSGMCIEVNAGGLRKPCHEIFPSEKLLKMCFENGVPITLGSDAHSPNDVGAGLEEAVKLARKIGYDEVTRFTDRKRDFVQL
jgi:histidinol-phosphatase (PHP family)